MNGITIIDQREVLGRKFRVYGDFENPLFLAKDVAEWIEHSNPSKMISDAELSESEVSRQTMGTLTNSYTALFVTEDGLYEILMQSRKPIAKKFKQEVKEVLRSIRKHGVYMTSDTLDKMIASPEFGIKLLSALQAERDKNTTLLVENEKQRQLIGELQPMADYVNHILSSTGAVTITQIAADYGISAQQLNKILYEERMQRRVGGQWILYHEHMDKGFTKSETVPITRSDGRPDTRLHTKWTQRGRLMINELLNRRGIRAYMDLVNI
jgi:prophage antirepressor-like protein